MRKILFLSISVTTAILLNISVFPLAYAANTDTQPETLEEHTFNVTENLSLGEEDQSLGYFSDTSHSPIVNFALMVLDFATKIIGSLAMILLIIAGFVYMFSQGNQQTLDKAKDILKYAIIGLIVTFLSYVAILFVQSIFAKG